MTDAVFAADPIRLLVAAAAGIILLLLLIIRFQFHPVLSLLISALVIGLGAGMPVPTLVNTVEKGAGETLQRQVCSKCKVHARGVKYAGI